MRAATRVFQNMDHYYSFIFNFLRLFLGFVRLFVFILVFTEGAVYLSSSCALLVSIAFHK